MADPEQSLPRLPPELEHEIFVTTLIADLEENLDPTYLLLVAKRASEWLTPILYEVVMTDNSLPYPPKINEKALKRHGHHVRHFHTASTSYLRFLSHCPNVTNLAVWSSLPDEDLEVIIKLPITRISACIQDFNDKGLDLVPFFSRITHIDILGFIHPIGLGKLPVLTHIALFDDVNPEDLRTCFVHAKSLKVVILVASHVELNPTDPLLVAKLEPDEDPRIVRMWFGRSYREDWKVGAVGGEDMWAFADDVVEKRCLGLGNSEGNAK